MITINYLSQLLSNKNMDYGSFKVIIKEDAGSDWNPSLLKGCTVSLHLYHTTFWADRLKELFGYKPFYFSILKGDELCFRLLGFSMNYRNSYTNLKQFSKYLLKDLFSGRKGNFFWYGQPIAFGEPLPSDYAFLGNLLNDFAQKQDLRISAGEWPLPMQSSTPSNWKMKRWATLKVDLTPDIEKIFANFKPSARKAIKRAEKDGISVHRIEGIVELNKYYQFAEQCCKRYGKKLYGFQDFFTMWKYLRTFGIYETFVAEHNNELIAGLSVWGYGKSIGELGSFQSERSVREKLYGPDMIKSEIIKWAKTRGVRYYDLAGISPVPENDKERNIRQFKEKWGGEYLEFLILTL